MDHYPREGMSLRVRLTLWYGTALAVVLIVFGVILYGVLAKVLKDQVDRSLEETAAVAQRSLEEHRFGPFFLFEDLSQDFPELATLDKFFQIFGPTGQITIQSPIYRAGTFRSAGLLWTPPWQVGPRLNRRDFMESHPFA